MASWLNSVSQTPFVVVTDHPTKSIIIAIRGSVSSDDWITDVSVYSGDNHLLSMLDYDVFFIHYYVASDLQIRPICKEIFVHKSDATYIRKYNNFVIILSIIGDCCTSK